MIRFVNVFKCECVCTSYRKINLCICGWNDILKLLTKRFNVAWCNAYHATTSTFHCRSLFWQYILNIHSINRNILVYDFSFYFFILRFFIRTICDNPHYSYCVVLMTYRRWKLNNKKKTDQTRKSFNRQICWSK